MIKTRIYSPDLEIDDLRERLNDALASVSIVDDLLQGLTTDDITDRAKDYLSFMLTSIATESFILKV